MAPLDNQVTVGDNANTNVGAVIFHISSCLLQLGLAEARDRRYMTKRMRGLAYASPHIFHTIIHT
jgi:hypothetical protein